MDHILKQDPNKTSIILKLAKSCIIFSCSYLLIKEYIISLKLFGSRVAQKESLWHALKFN